MGAFKLIRYELDPNGREWLPLETFVGSVEQLERVLATLIASRPTFVDLAAPNGDLLHLGVGGPVASVAFATPEMLREGRAIGPEGTVDADEAGEWVEFEAGGTPTPINRDVLVHAAELVTIARHFFETGEPHPDFTWE
jgi:hypothetical protein